jgi:signal transduction histidine kinase
MAGFVPAEKAFWVDPTGRADIEQAVLAPFAAMPEAMSLGYTQAHLWVRVTIAPTQQTDLVAAVKPSFLDYVTVYTRADSGLPSASKTDSAQQAWRKRKQGGKLPFSERERNDLLSSFRIQASAHAPTTFYVRIETSSFLAVSVEVGTERVMQNRVQLAYLGVGLWAGMIALMGLYSLARWFVSGSMLWGFNALVQGTAILFITLSVNLGDKHWPMQLLPWDAAEGRAMLACISLSAVLLYFWRLTLELGAPRWLVWLLASNLLLLPWQLWAINHGMVREALELNGYLLCFRAVTAFMMAFLLPIPDRTLRWMVRAGFVAMALYGLWYAVPLLGHLPLTEQHLSLPIGNLFSALIQFVILLRHDLVLSEEKNRLTSQIQLAETRLVWEQQRLSESASFMGMLLHELKNPLASIRLATMSLAGEHTLPLVDRRARGQSIQSAIDGIDAVLNRCRQVDKFEQGQWPSLQIQRHDVAALIRQWHFQGPRHERLQLDLPPELHQDVDAGLLQVVLGNLVDNALTYSPPDSEVRLQMQLRTQAVAIQIRNTVGRVGAPDPQRLFTKYYRADGAHHQTGCGLGLYLVQSLAQMMKASVHHWMEEQIVVFEIKLPAHD